jgi:hypothetical protein
MRGNAARATAAASLAAIAAVLIAACSSTPAPSAGAPGDPKVTVPLQTATSGEFFSPSKNISCEIDDTATLRQAFCETITPPRSVTMTVDGSFTRCAGQQCLGNAGENTPTLPYVSTTGTGPFHCSSTTLGMTCAVPSGKGFQIAAGGISPIGR